MIVPIVPVVPIDITKSINNAEKTDFGNIIVPIAKRTMGTITEKELRLCNKKFQVVYVFEVKAL